MAKTDSTTMLVVERRIHRYIFSAGGGGGDGGGGSGCGGGAKQHLLHKLHKFESLSDLDPIELEKRMIDEENKNYEESFLDQDEDYEEYEYESFSFEVQRRVDEFIEEIVTKFGFQEMKKPGMKRLISDLIVEEESVENALEVSDEQIIKRACKRLESWKEVESNTIDMMVEIDLSRVISGWKKPHEQIGETTKDIEVAIFRVLVEELLEDLSYSS